MNARERNTPAWHAQPPRRTTTSHVWRGAAFRPLRRKRGAMLRIRGSYVYCIRAPRLFSSVRGIRRTRRIISGRARPCSRAQAQARRRSRPRLQDVILSSDPLWRRVPPTRPSKLQARESNGAPAFHNKLSASVPGPHASRHDSPSGVGIGRRSGPAQVSTHGQLTHRAITSPMPSHSAHFFECMAAKLKGRAGEGRTGRLCPARRRTRTRSSFACTFVHFARGSRHGAVRHS